VGYYLTSRREIDEVLEESEAEAGQRGSEGGDKGDVAVCSQDRTAPT
jgi:hypothetical protein